MTYVIIIFDDIGKNYFYIEHYNFLIMKIIYDGITTFLQSHSGISVYFKELISRLPRNNFSLYFYLRSKQANFCSSIDMKPRYFQRYRDFLINKEVINTHSIFHSSYYRIPALKMPTVTTVHDFICERFRKGPAKWVHSWQKYRAIRNSDLVICISKNTANDLLKYCPISENKIRVIYNGVSDDYYPLNDNAAHTNKVIFVGTRSGYKNFDLAVLAVSKLPNLTLSIVGGRRLSKKELALLNHYLPDRYCWLGALSNTELNKAYNTAYALLYPSGYEGFGIPVLEAMRAGCPVVAVNTSSIPEVAGSAGILVEKAEVNQLADALHSVDNNRAEIKQAGIQQASRFSWDKCYQKTVDLYKELKN